MSCKITPHTANRSQNSSNLDNDTEMPLEPREQDGTDDQVEYVEGVGQEDYFL